LQKKVSNVVENYNIIHKSVESKLKESEKIYKIKKDLKRLKTVNDLPNILESQLNEYLALVQIDKKDIKILEKALNYYARCKAFIEHHKENVTKIRINKRNKIQKKII
jgi:hypothetical protein